jgi:hypothetical protein
MDLELDDYGRLRPESVDALEPDELSVWIRDRLHDRDHRVPDAPKQDIGQYYLIGAIYDNLALSTQADVRRALKRFLLEMEREEGEWTGRPAHTLLLLTKAVGEDELAPPIRRMAEDERFLPEDEELHARLLQTLVFLGEKMTPEFWKSQLERNPSHFGVYAFAGLRMHSLPKALGFVLNKVSLNDEDLRTRLTTEIRGLLAAPGYTREQLREQILSSRDFIPEDGYALIRRALPELDLEEMENGETEGDASQFSEARQFFGPNGDLSPNESLQPAAA